MRSNVPGAGFEPALPFGNKILSLVPTAEQGPSGPNESQPVASWRTLTHAIVTNPATGRRVSRKARRAEEWDRIRIAFGYCCAYCGKKAGFLHREHMFPKGRGGDDSIENIVPSCNRCNTVKGSRTPLEWFLTLDGKRPLRAHRTWPASDVPCWRCGGPCEIRRYTKNGPDYSRCTRCRGERAIDRRTLVAPSAGGRQP